MPLAPGEYCTLGGLSEIIAREGFKQKLLARRARGKFEKKNMGARARARTTARRREVVYDAVLLHSKAIADNGSLRVSSTLREIENVIYTPRGRKVIYVAAVVWWLVAARLFLVFRTSVLLHCVRIIFHTNTHV